MCCHCALYQKSKQGLLFSYLLLYITDSRNTHVSLPVAHSFHKVTSSFQSIKSPAPVLTCEGSEYQLYINGVAILATKTSKFTNALEALFQAYWVFSLEYPKQIEKTLLFLESYIFRHKSKLPACVSTWATKIGMKV